MRRDEEGGGGEGEDCGILPEDEEGGSGELVRSSGDSKGDGHQYGGDEARGDEERRRWRIGEFWESKH